MVPFVRKQLPAWGRATLLILSVAVTGTAAHALRSAAVVRADVTSAPPREQFKAGGERSEVVLREILSVLKKMDSRLERIEKAATDSVKTGRISSRASDPNSQQAGTP